MATATPKRPAVRPVTGQVDTSAFTFAVFEDNGGDHRWAILDADGESVARSRAFSSAEDARAAAAIARDVVQSAG
jgi:uncharacterized protein YegP (UPF0339 family)